MITEELTLDHRVKVFLNEDKHGENCCISKRERRAARIIEDLVQEVKRGKEENYVLKTIISGYAVQPPQLDFWEHIRDLQAALSRYEQAVTVEGNVNLLGNMMTFPSKWLPEHLANKRVTVLVMPHTNKTEGEN